jgi:hypothetical protein
MILILEILLLASGVYSLITAKPLLGKDKPKHPHFRFLGAFQIALLPVAVLLMIGVGVAYALKYGGNAEQTQRAVDDNKMVFILIELGLVAFWAIVSTVWDKAIRKRIATGR